MQSDCLLYFWLCRSCGSLTGREELAVAEHGGQLHEPRGEQNIDAGVLPLETTSRRLSVRPSHYKWQSGGRRLERRDSLEGVAVRTADVRVAADGGDVLR